MTISSMHRGFRVSVMAIGLGIVFGMTLGAQRAKAMPAPDKNAPPTQKVNPKEEKAYKKFYDINPQDADQRIQAGQEFLKKYPTGPYTEAVYSALVEAYYMKQDWKNFYATADKALALKPDDVDVLTRVGWVIPHVYNPNDPNAKKQLDKAEQYEKEALVDIPKLTKPASMTDEQFAAAKEADLEQAHSALGLVYFRRKDYANSAKELTLATQGAHPDPTDLYVLGLDLQTTQQYAQAADAFNRCAQIPGALQARCKQQANAATALPSAPGTQP